MANENSSFYFVGNLLCLDLVNTEIISHGERVDLLRGLPEFMEWLHAAGQLSARDARAAEQRWASTSEGKAAFAEMILLRGELRAMAERLSIGKPAGQASLDAINRVLASRAAYPQVFRKDAGYVTKMQTSTESPRHLVVPAAESAAWLLEHGDLSLLRRCENPNCILYFYDTTKNKRRRWCSMDACGSRAKAAAYYRRVRGARGDRSS
jgi:predicted RNA-binding Zn ribbon-like protein